MVTRLHTSQAWLKLRFVIQSKSISEMAKEARVSEMTIRRALESNGLIKKL